uniref:Uncharacterized protein n=1 Tax=Arundo donax TaxID=35708 RepID=A0A0A8YFI8_ARUDO
MLLIRLCNMYSKVAYTCLVTGKMEPCRIPRPKNVIPVLGTREQSGSCFVATFRK